MLKTFFASAVAALSIFVLAGSPAEALTVRAWVSGHGSDVASCGSPATPCRTLQYTHDNIVAAGGEIDILDPAGYGAITITKAISIVNDGVGTAGVQSNSGNAITVNAQANDSVYLRGLNIDGVEYGGTNGIEFEAGSVLTVVNCVIRHFHNDGLLIDPSTGHESVAISDSSFLENSESGIAYAPQSGDAVTSGVIDHVKASNNNASGIIVDGSNSSSQTRFTITNSDMSNNIFQGISANGAANTTIVEVNTSTMEHNAGFGLSANGTSAIHVARSVMDFNGTYGINNGASVPGGVFSSGDNHAEGNGTAPSTGIISVESLH